MLASRISFLFRASSRPLSLAGLASLSLALSACGSDAVAAASTTPLGSASSDARLAQAVAEFERLETELPAASPRRARPDGLHSALAPPAPREISQALTATVVLRAQGVRLSEETYRLSSDCVSFVDGRGSEWWLVRNPIRREELSGARVDPQAGLVLGYTAADLRLAGAEDLWDRIAALGGPMTLPAGLQATGRSEVAMGLSFAEHVATEEAAELREIWWNAEAGFALRLLARRGGEEFLREVVSLERGVAASALRHPSERHPNLKPQDLSDWYDSCGDMPAHAAAPHAGHDHQHAAEPPR